MKHFKKPFGTMSSLMSSDRYKNPHQIVSNRIRVISTAPFKHCKNEKRKSKKDVTISSPRTCNGEI